MTFLEAPSAVSSPDDLLEKARSIIDSDIDALANSPDITLSCRAGCGACCSQAVPVTAPELRAISSYLDGLPTARAAGLRARIRSTADRLRSEGFTARMLADTIDPTERRAMTRRYFAAGVPCPFLEQGSCTIRAVRPLVCREYVVTSDPAHCAALDEHIVRIRPRRNVLAGFRKLSATFGEGAQLVLALALDEPVPEAPIATSRSGPAALQLMMSTYLEAPTAPST